MKKFIAFVAVVGFAMAFVACGKKAETAETPATEEVVAPMDSVADTTATTTDTTGVQ
ncbi:MAG TPA: hypothetical protein VK589_16475 [Chryseolinea sp.]|nr:hypothetical protein [Chryseolinea sp.]